GVMVVQVEPITRRDQLGGDTNFAHVAEALRERPAKARPIELPDLRPESVPAAGCGDGVLVALGRYVCVEIDDTSRCGHRRGARPAAIVLIVTIYTDDTASVHDS